MSKHAECCAGFVIKTWRTDDKSKVFVNICAHPTVPYNPEESQADKEVFKILSDLKQTQVLLTAMLCINVSLVSVSG
jgi:hypothetical protein